MTKKALAITLGLMIVLLSACGTMPADEKESPNPTQTVSFPAGKETVSEEPQTETGTETSEPQETKPDKAVSETEEVSPSTDTARERISSQTEIPQSARTESQTPAAQQTEPKQAAAPAEKQQTEETPITPPKAAESEPEETAEPAAPKSIYDYEFDVEAIRQELLAIGTGMGLEIDSSLTPDSSSWGNPVTASKGFQGAALERSLKDYVRSMPDLITAYGGTPIRYFTVYAESLGGGSYRFYFLY